jgi:hypothetical protein
MPALLACDFEVEDLRRRQVKLRCREDLTQSGDVFAAQKHHEIHVVRQARFAVEDGRHAPADDVTHPKPVQRTQEQQ